MPMIIVKTTNDLVHVRISDYKFTFNKKKLYKNKSSITKTLWKNKAMQKHALIDTQKFIASLSKKDRTAAPVAHHPDGNIVTVREIEDFASCVHSSTTDPELRALINLVMNNDIDSVERLQNRRALTELPHEYSHGAVKVYELTHPPTASKSPHLQTQTDLEEIQNDQTIGETTRKQLTDARVGQGAFRLALMERCKRCALTGITTQDVLIASHIKPWRASDNQERTDPNNGILLAAHIDRLFDKGYITFTEDGTLKISPRLPESDQQKLGIKNGMQISLDPKTQPYMAHHRRHIYQE